MDNSIKEVAYWSYCTSCKHWKRKEEEMPCCECLEVPFRVGTKKPEKYEKAE